MSLLAAMPATTAPPRAMDSRTSHWLLLAPEAYAGVEYSYAEDPDAYGVMLPATDATLPRLERWAGSVGFAADWSWAVRRLVEYLRPTAYLFRTDWRRGRTHRLTAVTLYCRFPREPDDAAFAAAVRRAHPAGWSGSPPSAAATVLGVPGPRGMAIRGGESGNLALAIYYRVPETATTLSRDSATALVAACGIAAAAGEGLAADVQELYRGRPLGVVGLDDSERGRAGALKLNPANVPFATMSRFLTSHGAQAVRLDQLRATALALRADQASYLGVRYTDAGMTGWRLYLSVEPARLPSPLTPGLTDPLRPLPALRSPHH